MLLKPAKYLDPTDSMPFGRFRRRISDVADFNKRAVQVDHEDELDHRGGFWGPALIPGEGEGERPVDAQIFARDREGFIVSVEDAVGSPFAAPLEIDFAAGHS